MAKPPIVIVRDLRLFKPEDTPDEFLHALAKELSAGAVRTVGENNEQETRER